jgi:Lar family restriction alleviation protein
VNRDHPKFGVHDSHCWQNQYPTGCKYGPEWECPARPDVWPHPTYDEDGDNIFVTQLLDIVQRPGPHARNSMVLGEPVTYAHSADPEGVRYRGVANKLPEWAVDVRPDVIQGMLPCPFCGGEATISTYETESLWSHNTVTYTQVECETCDFQRATEPGHELEALDWWNMRAIVAGKS